MTDSSAPDSFKTCDEGDPAYGRRGSVLLPFLHNIRSALVFAFSIDCTDFVCEGAPP